MLGVDIEIKPHILAGTYERTAEMSEIQKEPLDFYDFFLDMALDTESLAPYSMISYLISKNPYADTLHEIAADILATALCHIEGAYALSLFHARKALELNPENIEHKQFLLFYFCIPEKLISDNEALNIAKEVLEKNPDHTISKDVIKTLTSKASEEDIEK